MLYPVLSKAVRNFDYMEYAANSFRLVDERWENLTGYINGSFEYIFVNGEIFGIQISEYERGEDFEFEGQFYITGQQGTPFTLGLNGKPIEALAGYVVQQPWYFRASLPRDLIFVTTVEAQQAANAIEWGMWPQVGVFNTATGELVIPVEFTQLILLDEIALGFNEGVMTVLDYNGNTLSSQGEGWFPTDYGFHEGDDLILVNETTYINLNGEIVLELDGIHGGSNFNGDYAWGWRPNYAASVIFDRQGHVVMEWPQGGIHRFGEYYVVNDGANDLLLDMSLQTVLTLSENEHANAVMDGRYIIYGWDPQTDQSNTRVVDTNLDELFSTDRHLWYNNGFLVHWDNGLSAIYDMDGRLIFENARVYIVSADGKFIYVDNGRHRGYIDHEGSWAYRTNAAFYNLED